MNQLEGPAHLARLAELISTAPARMFGLWPRKGSYVISAEKKEFRDPTLIS